MSRGSRFHNFASETVKRLELYHSSHTSGLSETGAAAPSSGAETRIHLPTAQFGGRRIQALRVSQVNLMNLIPNVRAKSSLLYLTMEGGATTDLAVVVPEGHYDVDTLLVAVNAAVDAAWVAAGNTTGTLVFSLNTEKTRYTLTMSEAGYTNVDCWGQYDGTDYRLAQMMGFHWNNERLDHFPPNGLTTTSNFVLNLLVDPYINLNIVGGNTTIAMRSFESGATVVTDALCTVPLTQGYGVEHFIQFTDQQWLQLGVNKHNTLTFLWTDSDGLALTFPDTMNWSAVLFVLMGSPQ